MNHRNLTRRDFLSLSAGGVVAGTLPLTARKLAAREGAVGRARSVVIVLLSGGPSQLDTWDPKPEAPDAIRGEFSSIDTATAGLRIGEHMPRLARRTDRVAVIRSLSHTEHNHLLATHVALTGRPTHSRDVTTARGSSSTMSRCFFGSIAS